MAAQDLRERLQRLEAAVEAMGLGLWEWDIASGALTWNRRNREFHGVDPDRPLTIDDYPQLIHPDDSGIAREAYLRAVEPGGSREFALEHRARAGAEGAARWLQLRGRVLCDDTGAVVRVVGSTLDVTDLRRAEERRSLLLRELAHRGKNGILVMMTLVAQTARGVGSVAEFEQVLAARLQALADSQDLVTQTDGGGLPLDSLFARVLEPFGRSRFDIDPGLGEIAVQSDLVVGLALLLHELATNAVKYGGLSAPDGRVALDLADAGGGLAVMTWRERGGPPVEPPSRKGFGTRLLEISLRSNGGRVEGEFGAEGFRARIEFPVADD